jgi:cytochrome c
MRFLLYFFTLIIITKVSYSDEKILILGDKEYGQHLAGECVTCHKANSNTGIPSINGYDKDVFVTVMLAYKNKEMQNPVMQMIAGRLDNEQIASLALYFDTLK